MSDRQLPPHLGEGLTTRAAEVDKLPETEGVDVSEALTPSADEITPALATDGTQLHVSEYRFEATTDSTTIDLDAPRNLVRLHPLQPSELPYNDVLAEAQAGGHALPDLRDFCKQVLREATQVMDHDMRKARDEHSKKLRLLPRPSRSKPSKAFVDHLEWKRSFEIPIIPSTGSDTVHAPTTSTVPPPETSKSLSGRFKKRLVTKKPTQKPTKKPFATKNEHWFARSSTHFDNEATWEDFERILCDDHSVNEQKYTDDIYVAHPVCTWGLGEEEIGGWRDVKLYGKFWPPQPYTLPKSNQRQRLRCVTT